MGLFSERRILSVVVFLLTAGLVVSTFGLTFADLGGAFSPMFFPRIILFVLLGLAGLDVIAKDSGKPIDFWPVAVISMSFLAYVLLLMPLGYFISSTAVGIIILLALGLRDPLRVVAVPMATAGALVGLFNHILKMPLPTSPFFWWI